MSNLRDLKQLVNQQRDMIHHFEGVLAEANALPTSSQHHLMVIQSILEESRMLLMNTLNEIQTLKSQTH